MRRKIMQTMFAAAVMLTAAAETFGGDKMQSSILTKKECAVADIGAAVARGDQTALAGALNRGFDAGITLNEAKEYVGQLYAYCGFPRALNAAATLMKVAAEKKPAEGSAPNPPPSGKAIDFGTANQTKLCGAPVKGPLFDFHLQLDEYLNTEPYCVEKVWTDVKVETMNVVILNHERVR